MIKGTYSLENREAAFMTSVHGSVLTGNDVLAFTSKVFYGSNGGSGDGIDVQKIKADILASACEEVEKSRSYHDESTTGERFVSVIDKRRAEMKNEENESELKQRLEENASTAPNKVNDLISKLKRRFSEEKEARADTIKPSYSQYIFSNSVDAFLRYHEKPKVDIQYSQSPEGSQEEGLYSFAVRPSRIRKQKKSTIDNQKEISNTSTSQSNTVVAVLQESYDLKKAEGSGNTVSTEQNIETSIDVFCYKDTEICNTQSMYMPADLPLMTKCTIPEVLYGHEIPTVDTNIQSVERVDNFLRPPTYKMVESADLLPSSSTLSFPTNPHFRVINPNHNIQLWKTVCYRDIYLKPKLNSLKRSTGVHIPSFQEFCIGHGMSEMLCSLNFVKNLRHIISSFQRANSSTGINVYEKGKWPPTTRKSDNSIPNVTFWKMSWEIEFPHSVPPTYIIHKGSKGNRINLRIQMDIDLIYGMQHFKMLLLPRTKELCGHSPTHSVLTVKGNKSNVTPAIHEMSFTVRIFDNSTDRINKVYGHLYKDICCKSECLENMTAFANFKRPIHQNFYQSVTPFKPDSKPESVHHESSPVSKVSTVGDIYDNEEIVDGKCRKVQETTSTTRDAITTEECDDDESLFGIMSVYCNSEIHSRFGKFCEAG